MFKIHTGKKERESASKVLILFVASLPTIFIFFPILNQDKRFHINISKHIDIEEHYSTNKLNQKYCFNFCFIE